MENLLLAEHSTSPYLSNPSFSGHQTFPFRYTWLKKGVDAVMDNPDNPNVFTADNAPVILGVGKNMVSSIRHWCTVAGLIKTDPSLRGAIITTGLGEAIFAEDGFDPFLEDPATLWLIHWKIATNINQATAWYWAFNILKKNQFVPSTFTEEMYEWAKQQKKSMRPASLNTLQRDVNCFIRTYCHSRNDAAVVEESFDCPLVELNLMSELPEGEGYEFQRGKKETLPIEIFTTTLIAFWISQFTERDALPFKELMSAPLSPGRIFRLDEDSMTTYLEKLEQLTDGALQYDETADLRQVYRHRDINPMQPLERYYG